MDFAPKEANLHRPAGNLARRAFRRFRKTEAGQALVEFTMVLPIFVLLLFGMIDFGRGFYTWLLLTNAAREGARVAAVQGSVSSVDARIYDSFCDSYPTSCGLNPAKLSITRNNIQGKRGEAVSIDLSYDFDYATPIGNIVTLLSGGTLNEPTITAHTSMRLE